MYGKATGDQIDLDEQIVDKDWARTALTEWFAKAANVRQMHSPGLPPAGKGVNLGEEDEGFWLKSKIYEPGAVKQVEEGGYTGYSIGIKAPRIIRDKVAKNGRIVGGKIVEVSLVDYPALESAKISIAKMADSGDVEYVGTVEPDATKREFSQHERDQAADAGHALPDGSYPIENTRDLENAIQSYGRAKDKDAAKKHIIQRAKDLGATDMLPADWPGSTKKDDKGEKMAALKRMHDLICPAYDLATVLFAHPEVAKDGMAAQLGPDALKLVYQMFQQELEEDGGTGKESWHLKELAELYANLVGFIRDEAWESVNQMMESLMLAAIADEHKAFNEQFPDLSLRPGDPPPPGAFRRPFITGGAARENATSTDKHPEKPAAQDPNPHGFDRGYIDAGHAREDATGGDKTPSEKPNAPAASEFDRGPLTAGQERESPASTPSDKPAPGSPARTFYTAAARDQMRAQLRAIHDSLAALDDTICPMGGHGADQSADVKADSTPAPVQMGNERNPQGGLSLAATPDLTKGEDIDAKVARAVGAAVETAKAAWDEEKTVLTKRIEEQGARIEELGAQPDPKAAPYRGPALAKPAEPAARKSAANDAILAAREQERREEITLLQKMATSAPEPAAKTWAAERLAAMTKQV